MSRGKILVIRGGAIGDFILTLPILSALRQSFPETQIEVLGYLHIAGIARAGGLAHEVRAIDARPLAGFFARGGQLDPELQKYFAGFAIIISYLYDPDLVFQTNVARCSKAQFIVGAHRADDKGSVHATDAYLKPLERLAIFEADPVPRLSIHTEQVASAHNLLALHPGSGSPRKNWPEEKWAELLAGLISKTDLKLMLVGGEAEEGRLERLAEALPASRVQVLRSLPLDQLAGHLSIANGFVGHDSGISHLAAAIGLPLLILWAETNEAVWKPRGARVHILRDAAGLNTLGVDRVLGAIVETFTPRAKS